VVKVFGALHFGQSKKARDFYSSERGRVRVSAGISRNGHRPAASPSQDLFRSLTSAAEHKGLIGRLPQTLIERPKAFLV
jgi:hypothetical protein